MEFWWNGMITLQKVLFIIACATTLIMIVQIILMLVGAGSNGFESAEGGLAGGADFDGDAGFDGGSDLAQSDLGAFGMKLLGMRSITAFLCIFSWIGYTCAYLMDWWWAVLIGVGAGLVASFLVAFLMTMVEKTQTDGTTNIRRAVGSSAEVYLRIPAERSGTGKINVIVQERMVEVNAVTDEKEDIPTGAAVIVDSVVSDGLVVVKKP
ncbi:MAG: hypothetical protein HPY94_01185 [Clostridia bacterium]|nr:hypothetical protein [Clostridia bacterium]